ncbi:hypothetical protein GCM10027049_13190 [Mucilaginibacter puniceus]
MKKLSLKLDGKQMLSKEQMKQISGANGTRCTYYCCPTHCTEMPFYTWYTSCPSHEACQDVGELVFECANSSDWVAALCKG